MGGSIEGEAVGLGAAADSLRPAGVINCPLINVFLGVLFSFMKGGTRGFLLADTKYSDVSIFCLAFSEIEAASSCTYRTRTGRLDGDGFMAVATDAPTGRPTAARARKPRCRREV